MSSEVRELLARICSMLTSLLKVVADSIHRVGEVDDRPYLFRLHPGTRAGVAQLVEQLICNQ